MKNLEELKTKCSDIMNRLSELSDDELKEVFGGIGEVNLEEIKRFIGENIKLNANLDDFIGQAQGLEYELRLKSDEEEKNNNLL